MKSIILFVALISTFSSFSQTEPYIKNKSGEIIYFDKVRKSFLGLKLVGVNEDGKQKIKKKEIESALIGPAKIGNDYKQIVLKKLKSDKLFSRFGTVSEGNKMYDVIIKNGSNMIISNKVTSHRNTGPSHIGGNPAGSYSHGTSGSSTIYYFVENDKCQQLIGFEWFSADFLKKLIKAFEKCKGAKEILTNYYESKGKVFKLYGMMKDLKKCYLAECFEV